MLQQQTVSSPYIRSHYIYGVARSEFVDGVSSPVVLVDFAGSARSFVADPATIADATTRAVGLLWIWDEPFALRSHMTYCLADGAIKVRRVAIVIPSMWSRAIFLMTKHVRRVYGVDAARVFVRDEAEAIRWLVEHGE